LTPKLPLAYTLGLHNGEDPTAQVTFLTNMVKNHTHFG